ncbi:hypothetical protein ACFPL7_22125 [Dongia soli]|uniref:Uncharacterized protein n=1 Tax=Dongia soli TaxID=600628 RepID=A0ABU5E9R5_9PROT|nr:hypothetical protein [Dongia soli]MDY0882288.1 hypothetical protein [Dongia soli]
MICRTAINQAGVARLSTPEPRGIFVLHETGGQPISLVGWHAGKRRSRVITDERALGLMRQLAMSALSGEAFRIWADEDGEQELGVVLPIHGLNLIVDLANAVRANHAALLRAAKLAGAA